MRNPCTYKAVCRKCIVVPDIEDRPVLCQKLECRDYTPCAKCHRNGGLNDMNICQFCNRSGKKTEEEMEELDLEMPGMQADPEIMALPGEPPEYLNESQKAYYLEQWAEYSGYYRDPTAYIICHYIILEEINLNYLNRVIFSRRSEARDAIIKQKMQCISTLKDLRAQLPEKEAQELSDDEKWISMIADRYAEEKGLVSTGNISRIFSEEAIALAPKLYHRADLEDMVKRSGFKMEGIEKLLEAIQERPAEAKELLRFYGFHLDEIYASSEGSRIDEEVLFESEDHDDEFA